MNDKTFNSLTDYEMKNQRESETFVNQEKLDDPLKDYRVSYFKDGRLTYSYTIRKDTDAFTVMQAAINTQEGEHCQVEVVDGV